ncbi:hypothetical protein ENUP19_0080G0083 [Entamoeba nuttalli]|uniref:Uncharacterized protein n=2 Tax=Entamoeba nuttalli TaxID=412467 RepID=A0ABQ0DEZ2_9EUKA
MEIPIPEEAFDKSAYFKIDRLNDRKGLATVILLMLWITLFTVMGFVKDPRNVYVNTSQKQWISGEFLNLVLSVVIPTIIFPVLLFYLGMNNGLSHHPLELILTIVIVIPLIYKKMGYFNFNWTITSIVYNTSFSFFFSSILIILPTIMLIVIFTIIIMLIFHSIISLNLIGYPGITPPMGFVASVLLMIFSNMFYYIFESIITMFLSATVSYKLHENKGLHPIEALIKTFSYRLGSASYAIESSFISKAISLCKLLIKIPIGTTFIGMKLKKFIEENNSTQTSISPFVFIGYYGHTYIHSKCGLNEKIKQSSMSSIFDELHLKELINIFESSMCGLVMTLVLLLSFIYYGGSVSYFTILLLMCSSQVIGLIGTLIKSLGEVMLFDCIEQLAEGKVLNEFTSLIQNLSNNIPQNRYNRVN